MNNIILYFIVIISLIYNLYVLLKYKKIPESLSETSYLFGNNRYLFTVYCLLIGLCLLILLLPLTNINLQFIPFIICIGLIFSGFSPFYKKGLDRKIHYIFAFLSFGMFILYIFLHVGWYWIIPYLIGIIILCFLNFKSYVYFAEILALLELIIYIWINLEEI